MMSPRVRKIALTAHVISSVGWFGAVAVFLALAVAGLVSRNAESVRAAYLAMEMTGWFVIVPFSVASFFTGLVQSLGTEWGLFRHYWIVIKLFIAVGATALLLLHMQPTSQVARAAGERILSSNDLRGLRVQLVGDAGAALVVLVAATALSVFKPQGRTPFDPAGGDRSRGSAPRWVKIFGGLALVLLLAVVIRHLASGAHTHH